MKGTLFQYFTSQGKSQSQSISKQQIKIEEQQADQTSIAKQPKENISPNHQEDVTPQRNRRRLKQAIDSDDEQKMEIEINQALEGVMAEEEDIMDPKNHVSEMKKSKPAAKKSTKEIVVKQEKTDRKNNDDEDAGAIYNDFDDATPEWARQGTSKDKNLRLHTEPDADPGSLFIPPQEFKKLTKAMQQYWAIKSENFDKIIFFKLGKFYELFYDDAMVGHRYLELNWMGKKMHTGFPEKAITKYAKMLIDFGFKVAIVDQTETPEQMQKRVTENKKSGAGQTEKIVQRELTQVLTRGTLDEDGIEQRVLMCITKNILSSSAEEYGVAMLERQTNVISLARIDNSDMSYHDLKTLITQTSPIEVVMEINNIAKHDPITKIFQAAHTQLSYLRKKMDNWDGRKIPTIFANSDFHSIPDGVSYFNNTPVVLNALTGLFSYLDTILIRQMVMNSAKYYVYDPKAHTKYMMLDNQSLYHLEILQSSYQGGKDNDYSLFGCINRTVTLGGKRLLKKWLCAPLFDKQLITERQDAVEDLLQNRTERDKFRTALKGLPDMENLCSRTYRYAVQAVNKAIYYEDFSTMRLKEFKELCTKFRQIDADLFELAKTDFRSSRIRKLLTRIETVESEDNSLIYTNNSGAGLPYITKHLDDFEQYIVWKDQKPLPRPGILEDYDDALKIQEEIVKQLNQYLEDIRKRFNDKTITYTHAKYRYELEVPAKLFEKNKPNDFEFTSSRQGFQRFHTAIIKEKIADLEIAEEETKNQLTNFVRHVFKHFYDNHKIWDRYTATLAELDVLISLSIWGQVSDGIMCRPKIVEDESPYIKMEEARHPSLAMIGLNFVPNDVCFGGDDPRFLLLTGPNMGGKSTTLRMVCVLSILAQIGAMVPCKSMELTPIDRIFTRLGARDQLMEGKSTFFIELEETLLPLKYGTKHSLFITDELGRGTSTYDGVAIAYSVMKHLVEVIQCRCIFATHFRALIEENMENTKNVHMACYVDKDRVVFLYKMKPGACPASFGINVAKVAGIPEEVINRSKQKSDEFEQQAGYHSYKNKFLKQHGDPFVTLDIKSTVDKKEIKQAYKTMARKYHPDKNKTPEAQTMFLKVKQAYDFLTDKTKLEEYFKWEQIGKIREQELKQTSAEQQLFANDLLRREKLAEKKKEEEDKVIEMKRQEEIARLNKQYEEENQARLQKEQEKMRFDLTHKDSYKKLNSIKVKWPKETIFTESMLRLLFKPYGPIKEVRLKPGKGKAQVEFHTTEAANQAVSSEKENGDLNVKFTMKNDKRLKLQEFLRSSKANLEKRDDSQLFSLSTDTLNRITHFYNKDSKVIIDNSRDQIKREQERRKMMEDILKEELMN